MFRYVTLFLGAKSSRISPDPLYYVGFSAEEDDDDDLDTFTTWVSGQEMMNDDDDGADDDDGNGDDDDDDVDDNQTPFYYVSFGATRGWRKMMIFTREYIVHSTFSIEAYQSNL